MEGTHDPAALAELAKGQLRKKIPALKEALEGRFRPHHALLVGQILAHIDYLDEAIAALSEEIDRVITPFADKVERLDTIRGVNCRRPDLVPPAVARRSAKIVRWSFEPRQSAAMLERTWGKALAAEGLLHLPPEQLPDAVSDQGRRCGSDRSGSS